MSSTAKTKLLKTDSRIAYQYAPRGAENCMTCAMFRTPDTCTAVSGFIVRNGWCKIFEPTGLAGVKK